MVSDMIRTNLNADECAHVRKAMRATFVMMVMMRKCIAYARSARAVNATIAERAALENLATCRKLNRERRAALRASEA